MFLNHKNEKFVCEYDSLKSWQNMVFEKNMVDQLVLGMLMMVNISLMLGMLMRVYIGLMDSHFKSA